MQLTKDNDKITLLVPKKFRGTFDSFCKTMGFTVITTEGVIRESRINRWDDIYKKIDKILGPSYQKPEDFLNKIIKLSPASATHFLSTFIVEINNPDKGEDMRRDLCAILNDVEHQCSDEDYQEALGIIKSKLLPLLYGKGEQESTECNT